MRKIRKNIPSTDDLRKINFDVKHTEKKEVEKQLNETNGQKAYYSGTIPERSRESKGPVVPKAIPRRTEEQRDVSIRETSKPKVRDEGTEHFITIPDPAGPRNSEDTGRGEQD